MKTYSVKEISELLGTNPETSFPLVFGGVLGTLAFEHIDGEYKIKNANISASELIQYLQREIFQHSQSINEKKQDIIHLQSEIQNEQMQIDALKSLVSSIETSLGEK